MAAAASRTTNPVLLALILAVAGYVVAVNRGDAPWALGFRMYLWMGAFVVLIRVLFRIVFGGGNGSYILFTLPEIPLPQWIAGIRLLGPVAAEQVLGGFYDGLRLATMLVCLGAANALANPKRMLRAVPAALYETGAAVVIALSVAPQLIESVLRVRNARRLRGGKGLRRILIPVLEDALERSLALAAAMDSRGYGRRAGLPRGFRLLTGVLVLGGLVGVCVGVYGLLDATTPRYLGTPMLVCGLLLAGVGFLLGGRRVVRSQYRPDPWQLREYAVTLCGVAAVAGLYFGLETQHLDLLTWPTVSVLPVAAILIAALPGVLGARNDRV